MSENADQTWLADQRKVAVAYLEQEGMAKPLPKEVPSFVIARCAKRAVASQLDCFVFHQGGILATTGREYLL